jgi:hypothetical protein
MLPNILAVAEEYQLTIDPKSLKRKEVMCKCPFCLEDANRQGKYHLSLNVHDLLFKCWFCKESGGVYRFIAKLSGETEAEVKAKMRAIQGKKGNYKPHPAEELTSAQLRLLGYSQKPNWFEFRKRDVEYFKRTLENLWADWQDYLDIQRRYAFQTLLMGIKIGKYSQALSQIEKKSKEIGYNLLPDVFKVYGDEKRPTWAEEAHVLVNEIYQKMPHRKVETAIA